MHAVFQLGKIGGVGGVRGIELVLNVQPQKANCMLAEFS